MVAQAKDRARDVQAKGRARVEAKVPANHLVMIVAHMRTEKVHIVRTDANTTIELF